MSIQSKPFLLSALFVAVLFIAGYSLLSNSNKTGITNDTQITLATMNGSKINLQDLNHYATVRTLSDMKIDALSLSAADRKKLVQEYTFNQLAAVKAKELNLIDEAELNSKLAVYKSWLERMYYIRHLRQEAASEELIKQRYEEIVSRYQGKQQIHTSHILVNTKSEAESLKKKLNKEKFEALAKSYSIDKGSAAQGGNLGFILAEKLVKPYQSAALSLKVGEISDPIQSQFGWHLIRLEGQKNVELKPYDQLRAKIVEMLISEKFNSEYQTMLTNANLELLFEQSDNSTSEKKQITK